MKFSLKIQAILMVLLLMGCSSAVVSRDSRGHKQDDGSKMPISNSVKKHLLLVPLMNEAPYGGDDLAVECTEELRRELNLTGEFVIDPDGDINSNSRQIYGGGGYQLISMGRKAKAAGINFILYGRIVDAKVREKKDEVGIIRKNKAFTEVNIELRFFDVMANKEIFHLTSDGFESL